MATETRRGCADEFKPQAVRMTAAEDLTLADAARRLGVNPEVPREWKKRFGPAAAAVDLTPDRVARDELRRLRQEARQLRMGREILETATAFSPGGRGNVSRSPATTPPSGRPG